MVEKMDRQPVASFGRMVYSGQESKGLSFSWTSGTVVGKGDGRSTYCHETWGHDASQMSSAQIFHNVGRWGNGINLWHWDIEGKKEIQVAHVLLMDHIHDLRDKISGKEMQLAYLARKIALNTWYRFEIAVESPKISIFFNGEQVIDERLEVPTYGMPGLIVNCGSDARVRLKNLRIRFLTPTRLQVEEYETDAATNWANYKRREIEAGRRKSMDGNSL